MLILKFKLYQIAPELDKRRMMFGDYNSFCLSFGKKFPSELYKCVYTGVIEEDNIQFALEKLFCKFNLDRPNDFTGRSMSVSDVIEIESPNGEKTFLFCDSIGFVKIDFQIPEQGGNKK